MLPRIGRLPQLDGSVVEVLVPPSAVRYCFVEGRVGRPDVPASLAGTFPLPNETLIGPMRPELDRGSRAPERRLSELGPLSPLLTAALIVGLTLGDWYERRRDFALYRMQRVSDGRIRTMLVVDTLLASSAPASIGWTLALLPLLWRPDPVVWSGSLADLIAATAVLVPLPVLAGTAFARVDPLRSIGS